MDIISVKEWAEKHGVSERTVRNYCAQGKIEGAQIVGKTWNIPADTEPPLRKNKGKTSPLLMRLREEKDSHYKGGIYHYVQVTLTYNSNHIEGSRLTEQQTRYIFETNTIGITNESVNIDDIIETTNHFKAIDYIIRIAEEKLTESVIKELHRIIKSGTSYEKKSWFRIGDYKSLPNEVGGMETTAPEEVKTEMSALLKSYNTKKNISLEDIIDFHHRFESIHPFQDGNGRVGRLIMFKECLRYGIVPFIITDELKIFYYRGLSEWNHIRGYLLDTCLTAQDAFKEKLDKAKIKY
jgi:Fic family protein